VCRGGGGITEAWNRKQTMMIINKKHKRKTYKNQRQKDDSLKVAQLLELHTNESDAILC
jgi:hypothetical protein